MLLLFSSSYANTVIINSEPDTSLTEYFPMEIGNQYQYMFRRISGGPMYSILNTFTITQDTVVSGNKYYKVKWRYNIVEWCRIDSTGKLFRYFNNQDNLIMDFSLDSGQVFNGYTIIKDTINIFGINTVQVNLGNHRFARKLGYIYYYWWYDIFGDTRYESERLIQFIRKIGDSTILYQQPYKAQFEINEINFNNFNLSGFITINHEYSRYYDPYNQQFAFNFIESAQLEGYYKKVDSIINISPNSLNNIQYSPVYSLSYNLDSLLLNDGFEFYYRFKTKDKSLVPQYAYYPDLGYLKVNYTPVSVENNSNLVNYLLHQNYPNPFNPTTKIKYSIPSLALRERVSEGRVRVLLKIYDVLGKEIATLVNEEKAPGEYEVEFDGSKLSSGVYFYKLTTGSFTEAKKMIIIR